MIISASIVLYNHDHQVIRKLVESLVIQGTTCVYLVDNSQSNSERFYVGLTNGVYQHRPQNPGFGASHNWAISQSLTNGGQFHFVVNPDVYLGDNVILPMVNYMATEKNIGMMMPKILNMDGSVQYLPKLLPTPISLLKRKFPNFFKKFVESYELRNVPNWGW